MSLDTGLARPAVQTPSVAVLICAYTEERWDDLLAAVDSVLEQSLLPDDIVVIVDYNPGLQARLEARFEPTGVVRVVGNTDMKGLSGARNTGVAAVGAEVVAFLDDDAVADRSWLSNLIDVYSNPSVLGVGGASEPSWDAGRPNWFPGEFDWVVGCTYEGMPRRMAEVRNMIGSNMSFRRSVVLDAGGFDPEMGRKGDAKLPQGAEETELCIRASGNQDDGFFVFAPDARVGHRVRDERATLAYFTRRCWAEGLSKAAATRKVGGAALSAERAHVMRALPVGVARGLRDSVQERSFDGIRRSGAIGIGLAATVGGFVKGRLNKTGLSRG